MSMAPLILAVPSKGRLMESASEMFANAGMPIRKTGHERGYRGEIVDMRVVEIDNIGRHCRPILSISSRPIYRFLVHHLRPLSASRI